MSKKDIYAEMIAEYRHINAELVQKYGLKNAHAASRRIERIKALQRRMEVWQKKLDKVYTPADETACHAMLEHTQSEIQALTIELVALRLTN